MKEAILLAAGLGTRLKPITDHTPKCLVDLNGKPLLAYWLDDLSQQGITKFYINTHYLADQVEEFISQSTYKDQVELYYEEKLLGTAGSLRSMLGETQTENVFVAHADNYCECDWTLFFNIHRSRRQNIDMTMMTFEAPNPQSCGVVEVDEYNCVVNFFEKWKEPPTNIASAAIFILNKSNILGHLNQLKVSEPDISYHLIPQLLGHIQAWKNNGYICDIGTIETLEQTQQYLQNK